MGKILIIWLKISPADYQAFEDEIMETLLKFAEHKQCVLFSKEGTLSEAKKLFHN